MKKHIRLVMIVVLTLILLTSIVIMVACNNDTPQISDTQYTPAEAFRFELLKDDSYEIVNYLGDYTEINIPATFRGKPVTSINRSAFKNCANLSNIIFPKSLNAIEPRALEDTAWFENQPNGLVYAGHILYGIKGTLNTVELEVKDGTEIINNKVFRDIYNVDRIVLPNSIISIKEDAFNGCYSKIIWGENPKLTTLTQYSFRGYHGENFDLPKSLLTIENSSLDDTDFWELVIPNNIKQIGYYAFSHCNNLQTLTLATPISIGAVPKTLCNIIYIGDNIPDNTFNNISTLQSVKLSKKLKNIGNKAFYNCKSLKTIYFEGNAREWDLIPKGNLWDYYEYCDPNVIIIDPTGPITTKTNKQLKYNTYFNSTIYFT